MTARTLVQFLFGHAGAIREIAGRRAWFPLGAALVLLTSIPRNYDQTWIGEKPVLWLLGPLLFSFVSGTFLFAVLHEFFLRRKQGPDSPRSPWGSQWVSFMGCFWLTAPVAWVYAVPVERFLDPLTATKANLALLALVATWRVLLMARVVNVVCGARFGAALVWVLVPALAEAFALTFFSEACGKQLMSSMAGMRNSPEEDIKLETVQTVMLVSMIGLPAFLLTGIALRAKSKEAFRPFPAPARTPTPWLFLLASLVAWLAIAVPAQLQVRNNAATEALFDSGQHRAALDYLAASQPGDLAPSRPLPPLAFEWDAFDEVPAALSVVRAGDPPWLRAHLVRRFDEICSHFDSDRRGGSLRDAILLAFRAPLPATGSDPSMASNGYRRAGSGSQGTGSSCMLSRKSRPSSPIPHPGHRMTSALWSQAEKKMKRSGTGHVWRPG
jgi:hypothetical protein